VVWENALRAFSHTTQYLPCAASPRGKPGKRLILAPARSTLSVLRGFAARQPAKKGRGR